MTTGTNQFVPFATGTGANVYSNSAYTGLAARTAGVSDGIADGPTFNSAWRQGTSVAAMIGQFIAAKGFDALDDGDIATLEAHFEAAIGVLIAAGMTTLPASSFIHYGTDTGVADALVATVTPAVTSYADGHIYEITPAHTTATATPTINISGLGAKSIVHADGTALLAGEIKVGTKVLLAYDSTLGKVVMIGATKSYVDAKVSGLLPADASGYLHDDGAGNLSWATPSSTGTALPTNAVGYLHNDGSGTLAWSDPTTSTITAGGIGSTYLAFTESIGSYTIGNTYAASSITSTRSPFMKNPNPLTGTWKLIEWINLPGMDGTSALLVWLRVV